MHPPQHDRLSWEPAPRPRSARYLFILDRFSGFYMSAAFNYDELAPSPVSNDREAGGDQTRHRFRSWWRVWPVKLQACLSLRVLGPDYYARISQHSASHEACHSPPNPPLLGESRPCSMLSPLYKHLGNVQADFSNVCTIPKGAKSLSTWVVYPGLLYVIFHVIGVIHFPSRSVFQINTSMTRLSHGLPACTWVYPGA